MASRRPVNAASPTEPLSEPQADSGGALPPASSLLTYYAATQRQDTRGRIEEYADRHGRVSEVCGDALIFGSSIATTRLSRSQMKLISRVGCSGTVGGATNEGALRKSSSASLSAFIFASLRWTRNTL